MNSHVDKKNYTCAEKAHEERCVRRAAQQTDQVRSVDLVAEIKALNPNADQSEAIAAFAYVVVNGKGGEAFIRELVAGFLTGGRVYLPECQTPSSWALSQARRIAACISDT